jgi:two-component system, response regulator YesN
MAATWSSALEAMIAAELPCGLAAQCKEVSTMDGENQFTVVVIEDEELILHNIAKKIQESGLGFVVSGTATDGTAALEIIEQVLPDVVVTDIRMPVMDGLELLKQISVKYPYMKKIVISGHDDFKYAQQAIKYDVSDYLLKPLKITELTASLTRIKFMLENEKKITHQNKLGNTGGHIYTAEEIVKTVELYIRENYASDINFDKIAQSYNFNSSYLSKIFTKYFGENPSKYLILLRINKAKHLLAAERDLSVKDVGERVGYPDQFYFSRIFKNVTGVSPAYFKAVNSRKST